MFWTGYKCGDGVMFCVSVWSMWHLSSKFTSKMLRLAMPILPSYVSTTALHFQHFHSFCLVNLLYAIKKCAKIRDVPGLPSFSPAVSFSILLSFPSFVWPWIGKRSDWLPCIRKSKIQLMSDDVRWTFAYSKRKLPETKRMNRSVIPTPSKTKTCCAHCAIN